MIKMDKKVLIIGAIVAIVVIIVAALMFMPQVKTMYDGEGTIDAKSSDLTFKYNNDESIYGAYINGEFDHVMYYDEAKINGKVKLDLDDVKWDESYVPMNTTDDDGKDVIHVNNVTFFESNFTDQIMEDYENGKLNMTMDIYLETSNGTTVRSDTSWSGETDSNGNSVALPYMVDSISLKDGVLTVKIDKDYHSDTSTSISNDDDYEGTLLDYQNDDHKISQATIYITFYNDQYTYSLECVLDGDDFSSVHM
jgi:hypothetical protein